MEAWMAHEELRTKGKAHEDITTTAWRTGQQINKQTTHVTSFASPNLAKLGWSLVLVAAEEVVGVLQATGEREVILIVAVVPVMSHFLLAVWQHLRHAEKHEARRANRSCRSL